MHNNQKSTEKVGHEEADLSASRPFQTGTNWSSTALPSVPPEAWNNPYYPLTEPPKNEAERARLRSYLSAQNDVVQQAFGRKKYQAVRIREGAMSNCSDLQWNLHECVSGQWFGKFRYQCQRLEEQLTACLEMQSEKSIFSGNTGDDNEMHDANRNGSMNSNYY